jgi:uncharacterized protein YggU (UPF0235/DUF167 family)
MLIHVRVKTNCSETKIENFGDRRYLVYLKSRPENNEANIELIRAMAKLIGVPSTKVKITSGLSSKDKILEIQ